jgi:hypothetical protein
MGKRRSKKEKKKPPKPFELSPRQKEIIQHWQFVESVSPKQTAVIDDCGLSTVYERLQSGEYQAVKDGRSTKILTASIKARRANLPRAEFGIA